jgi:hypothetical protein
MATTKKKTFDAVEQSRRWRIETGRKLGAMSPDERREHLAKVREDFFAARSVGKKAVLAQR